MYGCRDAEPVEQESRAAEAASKQPGVEASIDLSAVQGRLNEFKGRLKTALVEGLAQSPAQAIDACRLEAPKIAKDLSHGTLRVGRTSHRLRNPANAPEPWMRPLLETFAEASPGTIPHRTVSLGGGRYGYAEPIYMQPLCLTCHGTEIAPSIQARLDEAYPDDQATGYGVGAFRGLFWAEFSPETGTPSASGS
jgi:hypothetical protein